MDEDRSRTEKTTSKKRRFEAEKKWPELSALTIVICFRIESVDTSSSKS
jgi:hypothetical protein